jgi:biopolymer transport protein TolR
MAGAVSDNDEEITGINVTPLVDIVLVLLIIFMVTANFIVRDTMEVDVPRAANGGETVEGLISVVMNPEGKLFFNGAEVDEAELLRKTNEEVAKQPETRALISADKGLPYGNVMRVIDLLKSQGVTKFAHNVEREVAPSPAP